MPKLRFFFSKPLCGRLWAGTLIISTTKLRKVRMWNADISYNVACLGRVTQIFCPVQSNAKPLNEEPNNFPLQLARQGQFHTFKALIVDSMRRNGKPSGWLPRQMRMAAFRTPSAGMLECQTQGESRSAHSVFKIAGLQTGMG